MNTRLMNRLNMLHAVDSVFTTHPAILHSLQPLDAAITQYRALLVETAQVAYQQGSLTVGVRVAKENDRFLAVQQAEVIANALRAYAVASGNAALTEQLRFTETDLFKSNLNHTIQLFERVRDAAHTHASALVD